MYGFINLNKSANLTSHDVINKLRKITGIKQIGHGGTLDKLATGVLPIAIGKATRFIQFLPTNKTYIATILLGLTTDTYDLDGKVINDCTDRVDFNYQEIYDCVMGFIGEQKQKPPLYSACKLNGKRLSDYARSNIILAEVASRKIIINNIKILNIDLPYLSIEVDCQSGTYIRSLAFDIGNKLGVGACLKHLQRTKSGNFTITDALDLDYLSNLSSNELNQSSVIQPCQTVLNFPQIIIEDAKIASKINNGQSVSSLDLGAETIADPKILVIFGENMAIMELQENSYYHPKVVLK